MLHDVCTIILLLHLPEKPYFNYTIRIKYFPKINAFFQIKFENTNIRMQALHCQNKTSHNTRIIIKCCIHFLKIQFFFKKKLYFLLGLYDTRVNANLSIIQLRCTFFYIHIIQVYFLAKIVHAASVLIFEKTQKISIFQKFSNG